MSASARWTGWTVVAVACGLAAAWLVDRRGPLEQRVLSRVPAGSAIVAYAELDALRGSDLLGRLVRDRLRGSAGLALVEPDVEAVAVAVGRDEIVGLAAGSLPFALVRSYLERQGASCPAPLDEAACSMPATGGFLSIRGLEPGLLGVTNGPRRDGADRLAAAGAADADLALRAKGSLNAGALVWAAIDPRLLAETMSDPPEGWINLSLVARALLSARRASLDLRDHPQGNAVRATLRADCDSAEDAVELGKMLESLTNLLATALKTSDSASSRAWAHALEERFQKETNGTSAAVHWLLPADLLREAIDSGLDR